MLQGRVGHGGAGTACPHLDDGVRGPVAQARGEVAREPAAVGVVAGQPAVGDLDGVDGAQRGGGLVELIEVRNDAPLLTI
ncbi:hypothetical protein GCM10009648_33670 [Tsukamurella spumae]